MNFTFLELDKMETKVASIILGLQLSALSMFLVFPDYSNSFDVVNTTSGEKLWFVWLFFSGGLVWVGALLNIKSLRIFGLVSSQTLWFMLLGFVLWTNKITPMVALLALNGSGCLWLLSVEVVEHMKKELKVRRRTDLSRKDDLAGGP